MDSEDNGLLDRDRLQSQIIQQHQLISQRTIMNSRNPVPDNDVEEQEIQPQSHPQPLDTSSKTPSEQAAEDEEEQDQVRMMVRYWRSKSLPYAYLPQFGEPPPSGHTHRHGQHGHPNNTSIDSDARSGCSSVFCSDICSNGSGHHSHHSHDSKRTTCNYNDPGCKPGSCSGDGGGSVRRSGGGDRNPGGNRNRDRDHDMRCGVANIPDRMKGKNGQIKNLGGGSSNPSGEQESIGEGKRRMDWRTLQQHYYPEGGWGFFVTFCAVCCHAISIGFQIYLSNIIFHRFHTGWLGSLSMGVSLFLSPLWVSIAKRKSTRLSAVFGGLMGSLGCLFTSFASQFHQICISYGIFVGIGVGLTRDASSLMVGQYFKRKRDLVEIFVVSGSGLGLLLMSISIHSAVSSLGWRLGLQAVTGSLFLTFFFGTCYRSASLYHPQRRAILHLKNQKRKIKDKEKREDKPSFIDFKCLKSKTLQILLLSSAFTAFGINTPLFHLALECKAEGEDHYSLVLLHIYIGVSWILGCFLFGLMVIQKNAECRVSKQYLCQMASVICGISIIALTAVEGFGGLVIFGWVYGFALGGYNYALKVYTYERVRARHFPRAWSFVQCAQAIPLILGVPLTGHMNAVIGWKSGYYLSALAVFVGSAFLFLTDVRRRRLSRRKTPNSSMKTNETTESVQSPKMRRLSFSYPLEQFPTQSKHDSDGQGGGGLDPDMLAKELTCISEEGLVDMDFQDVYFDDWAEYFGECITSCNKVENCLASEYDPDYAVMVERRARRWSAARPSFAQAAHAGIGTTAAALAGGIVGVHNHPPMLLPSSQHPPSYPHLSLIPPYQNHYQNQIGISNGNFPEGGEMLPLNYEMMANSHPLSQQVPTTSSNNSGLREIPMFRNPGRNTSTRNGPPPRSITVIDEASV